MKMKRRDDKSRMPQHEDQLVAWTPRVQLQGTTGATGPLRIVVGVDGSPASIDALRWAVRHAQLTGGTVESVISWHLPLYGTEYGAAAVDWAGMARETLNLAVQQVITAGCCTTRVVRGQPVDVLLQVAAGADLLVVGSRGLGGLLGILLQSVSKRVVAQATCPVVVIHHHRLPRPGGRTRAPSPSTPIRIDGHPPRRVGTNPTAASLSAHERGILDQLEQEFTDRQPSAASTLTRRTGQTPPRPSPLLLGLLPIALVRIVPITTVLGALASVTGLILLAVPSTCCAPDPPIPDWHPIGTPTTIRHDRRRAGVRLDNGSSEAPGRSAVDGDLRGMSTARWCLRRRTAHSPVHFRLVRPATKAGTSTFGPSEFRSCRHNASLSRIPTRN